MSGDISGPRNLLEGCSDIEWVEARNAAKHLAQSSLQLAPNVSSAEAACVSLVRGTLIHPKRSSSI